MTQYSDEGGRRYTLRPNGKRSYLVEPGESVTVPQFAMDSAAPSSADSYQRGLDALNAWRGDGNRPVTTDTSLAMQIAARDELLPSTAGNAIDEAAAFDASVNDLNAWRDSE